MVLMHDDVRRLTLGLMGLDELHLRVLSTSSEDLVEKRNAQKGACLLNCELFAISGTILR